MNLLLYLKAVVGRGRRQRLSIYRRWAVSYVPALANVHAALSILLVALLTGGAVYETPNKEPT